MSSIKMIKVLSVCQPWAECIVAKGKNVENRSWNTKKRGYFAIHASAAKDLERFQWLKDYRLKLDPDDLPYGAIVGFVCLDDVVTKKTLSRNTKKWFAGDYGFVLSGVIKLKKPVPAKGALGFWKLKGIPLKKALSQLSANQIKKIEKHALI